jgi:hypothetical protein
MHIVALAHYSASKARQAKALIEGAAVNFRQHYESPEHPDAYRAYCRRFHLGHMPRFASRLFVAAGKPSPIKATICSVSGRGKSLEVVVDIKSPLHEAPAACSLQSPAPAGRGVYAIVNVRNLKAYIGCTENFEARRKQHLQALRQGAHPSKNLQRDWHQAPDNFAFVVIKESPADLLAEERYRKNIYHTEDSSVGYNQGEGFAPASQPRPPSVATAPVTAGQQLAGVSTWQASRGYTGPIYTPPAAGSPAVHTETASRPAPPKAPQTAGCMVVLGMVLAAGIAITVLSIFEAVAFRAGY